MTVTSRLISHTIDAYGDKHEIWNYEIANEHIFVALSNYGCTVLKILSADRHGSFGDVVLGYENIEDYINDPFYMNCVVGRFAGRIKNASYSLGGKKVNLKKNTVAGHQLHGGPSGLNKEFWRCAQISNDETCLTLKHVSPDRDQGHPGRLELLAKFELQANTLHISYSAQTDRATHVNLTQHLYFNLSAANHSKQDLEDRAHSATIDNHVLMLQSSRYLETDAEIIPTGHALSVAQTDFDFRTAKSIGSTILDTYFLFDDGQQDDFQAKLIDPASGRKLTMRSNQPGLQVYTSEYLSELFLAKRGFRLGKRAGVCLEFQGFPDAPNHTHFPSTFLPAGVTRTYATSYTFEAGD